jgi:hypothetical protein
VVEVWVTPRTRPSLFPDGLVSEPRPLPNFCFRTEVQSLGGMEGHVLRNRWVFSNFTPYPFIQKG